MIYYQKWSKDSFEYNFLKEVKQIVKDNQNLKIYFGFDYGFFHGMNIYYKENNEYADKIYNELKKKKIDIRLFTNCSYDFDLILLFGYTNNKQEIKKIKKNKKKIIKALSNL